HDIFNGLIGNGFLHFLDNIGCRHFALRRFDENDVILHLNSDTAVSACNHVNAVGKLFRGNRRRGSTAASRGTSAAFGRSTATFSWSPTASARSTTPSAGGSYRLRGGSICFDIGDGQIRPRKPQACLHDVCWKFHATEIFVSGICLLDEHVSDD